MGQKFCGANPTSRARSLSRESQQLVHRISRTAISVSAFTIKAMKSLLPARVFVRTPAVPSSRTPFICSSCRLSGRRFAATQAGPSPPKLPAAGYSPLSSRRLISIAGVDAPKFLQGLITASVYSKGTELRERGFYTGLLTAQGRVLHDLWIYPNPNHYGLADAHKSGLLPGQAFLIEVADSQVDTLMKLIRRYKLRSAVTHRKLELDECSVWTYWDESYHGTEYPDKLPRHGSEAYVTADSRAPDLGYRVITPASNSLTVDAERLPEDVYQVRRYLRGVAEGPDEITPDKTLPLDANMDLMGGIDFRKGCYVGQELTIRTKHRGVVRKRILPCMVYGEDEPAPQDLEYRPAPGAASGALDVPGGTEIIRAGPQRSRRTGNWIHGVGNIGLAMCRLQSMTDVELPGENTETPFDPSQEFVFKSSPSEEGAEGAKKLKVKAFVPQWMKTRLAQSNTSHSRQTDE
ncbi:hypothetical protein JX266_013109 [Neoarthrinium moseri]|uniref:uncharacterized protein n=1 Tax=Neoarthrinium moseri TaxID=1658444 RepID=UPI001FDD9E04|nr:uncharacterized protein JN550_010080 [Neoarthrinium moseri]KAI1840702.1 hypothetical protein JX266_013109 [Neoarthrinium moseri]KAI1862743.1 hypothetical protein JN550_010080 [Neoarthrinium moseri]